MNPLPDDQMVRFDQAVRGFSGVVAVSVTPEKVRAFLEATRNIDMPPANRLRWLAIELGREKGTS